MRMTRMVILANSLKHGDRCLAGIDLDTGKWVRPVTRLDDGRVREKDMKQSGHVPALLDILEIPLDSTGPDFGFESENKTILAGPWRHVGRLTPDEIEQYVEQPRYVLHNSDKCVSPTMLRQKPFEERITLQLIRVETFKVRDAQTIGWEKRKWKGTITSDGRPLEVGITDPVYFEKLNKGHEPSPPCLLTVSLGMPYKPPGWDGEPQCWKLIAAVIELQ